MRSFVFLLLCFNLLYASPRLIEQNKILELEFLSSLEVENPFTDITLDLMVTNKSGNRTVIPAFWAGHGVWKARFSTPVTGTYTYQTRCSDTTNFSLHDQTGEISVLPYHGDNPLFRHGPLKIDSTRHIVHQDGTPFLWLADSWWHGMTSRFSWPNDFQILTQDRKDKGFSVIQFAIGYPCDISEFDPRGANESGFPTSRDYTTINPEYFDLTDKRIQHLVENGLVPNILGTWGYYLSWFGIENMNRYWRYLIARYGAYPVTWTLAGETTLTYYLLEETKRDSILEFQKTGWSEVARFIKKTDPFHRLLTAHPGPASGRFQPVSDMSLLDIIMVQPGHGGWDTLPAALQHLKRAMQIYQDRPVMQGEVCFEGMHGGGCDAKLQRMLFWTNMLSGAVGHCYGADGIWQFNTKEQLFGPSPGGYAWGNTPWEEAYRWQGSHYVGLGRKILQRFDWHHFTPHPKWIDPAANEKQVQHAYAAGIPGKERLFYFPRGVMPWGQRFTIRHLDCTATYQATFIDPLTGKEFPLEHPITRVKEWTIPHAPILQDWLLSLETHD